MSKITNIIFNGKEHYITSQYGSRGVLSTSSGKTAPFHYGTDYGTNGKKIAQYAIENGTVLSCGTADDGARFVWVKYPRINKKLLHYHLDRICVCKGQSVKKGTLIGYTGKTGKATGVHLHLGVKDLTTDRYENPESFAVGYKEEYRCGNYKIATELLRVRKQATTKSNYLKFSQLTANAQAQVKKLNGGKAADGLVRGCECTVSSINGNWGKIPSGWICLDWCRRV